MTKLEIMQLSQSLSDLYTGLETDLIANIAEYLRKGNIDTPTAQWKIQMLAKLGALDKANIRIIAEYTDVASDMLKEVLEIAALNGIKELETGFQELVKDGIVNGATVPIDKTTAKAIMSYQKQAKQSLNLVNTVMRYKARSVAQKVINDTAELAEKQTFINMLNKTAGKVVTGIESRQVAMRQCIKEMSEKGIPAFVDKLGREWSPEAYINMDIRTTVANTAQQAQFDRMDDYGLDLIAVSSHAGARPKCAKDQGKIFNRKNKDGYTTDLHGKKIRYYSWKRSSYGEPDGILGINCGHHIYPFIPGVSYQTYFPYDDYENQEQYKKIQGQRELERRVRKSKRECMTLDTLGDKEGFQKASQTLKQRQQALKQYCSDNDLKYKPDRTAVVGYNRSVAGKVKTVNRKKISVNQPDGFNSNFKVNEKVIESKSFANKFKGVTSNPLGDKKIIKYAKKCVYNNDGFDTEDIYLLKSFSGVLVDNKKTGAYGGSISLDIDNFKENTLILVHNHPNSVAFSFADFVTLNDTPEIKTMIAVGHNGTVYKMSVGKGKRLDFTTNKEYNYYRNLWNRAYSHNRQDLDAVLLFTRELGWSFEKK